MERDIEAVVQVFVVVGDRLRHPSSAASRARHLRGVSRCAALVSA